MNAQSIAAALALSAGAVTTAHAEAPRLLEGRTRPAGPITYVYINAATGERLFTAEPGRPVSPGRSSSDEVWIADNTTPCAAYGLTTGIIGIVDDPGNGTPVATGAMFSDWGDVPFDTVVDCVQVTWSSAHADVDADGDGHADGIRGFGASWRWVDLDDGWFHCTLPTPIVGFTLHGLPGNHRPDEHEFATYIATVDLVGDFDESLSFEICDSDGDPQGAAYFNPFIAIRDIDFDGVLDGDMDGDGLGDFSYGQTFHQPGTMDFDGDGLADGDPAGAAQTALLMVAPFGPAVPADPGWTIDPVAPLPAAQGMEDAFDIYLDPTGNGWYWSTYGTFFYGGFSCDEDGNGTPGDDPGDYRPFSQFYHVLYGPQSVDPQPCRADVFPPGGDGVLNYFDVSSFIAMFNAGDPNADFFPPAGGDGVFGFFDISIFIIEFNAGCP